MRKSFYATYWMTSGGLLVGGVSRSQTCRYGEMRDLETRLACLNELNGKHFISQIHPSLEHPEIFPHCLGGPATAIGCACPECKHVLTIADAIEWQRHPLPLTTMTDTQKVNRLTVALRGLVDEIRALVAEAYPHPTGAFVVPAAVMERVIRVANCCAQLTGDKPCA